MPIWRPQVEKNADPIADGIERGLDAAHRRVNPLLWPSKPIDSVIHGTHGTVDVALPEALLRDKHPNGTKNTTKKPKTKKKPIFPGNSDDDSGDDGDDGDDFVRDLRDRSNISSCIIRNFSSCISSYMPKNRGPNS